MSDVGTPLVTEVTPAVTLLDTAGLKVDQIQLIKDINLLKIYYGFRRCYSGATHGFLEVESIRDFTYLGILSEEERTKIENFIRRMRKTPHESPLEHVSMTFSVINMDRAISHQWVRHRIASHSQCSQRYVDNKQLNVTVPESIKNDPDAHLHFVTLMKHIHDVYNYFLDRGIKPEDARSILPNCTATHIVTTMNLRELIHFFNERCCYRAQKGIRDIAYSMLGICKTMYPCVFDNVGAKCVALKKCPEKEPCKEKPFKPKVD